MTRARKLAELMKTAFVTLYLCGFLEKLYEFLFGGPGPHGPRPWS